MHSYHHARNQNAISVTEPWKNLSKYFMNHVSGSCEQFIFSDFSVGFCIYEEKGYLLPTLAWKIALPTFRLNAPVIIRAKVKKVRTNITIYTRGWQQKKSRTPRGEISRNQVEIMRNQSRFP